MNSKNRNQKEDFEYWLFEMDEAIQEFKNKLDQSISSRLDFTLESLDILESWILKQYNSPKDILEREEMETLDGLARYVGETYRKLIGGYWEIRFDDPKYAFYGLPQLTGFCEKATPICPHSLLTAAIDRRKGIYIRTILENTKNRLNS